MIAFICKSNSLIFNVRIICHLIFKQNTSIDSCVRTNVFSYLLPSLVFAEKIIKPSKFLSFLKNLSEFTLRIIFDLFLLEFWNEERFGFPIPLLILPYWLYSRVLFCPTYCANSKVYIIQEGCAIHLTHDDARIVYH